MNLVNQIQTLLSTESYDKLSRLLKKEMKDHI